MVAFVSSSGIMPPDADAEFWIQRTTKNQAIAWADFKGQRFSLSHNEHEKRWRVERWYDLPSGSYLHERGISRIVDQSTGEQILTDLTSDINALYDHVKEFSPLLAEPTPSPLPKLLQHVSNALNIPPIKLAWEPALGETVDITALVEHGRSLALFDSILSK